MAKSPNSGCGPRRKSPQVTLEMAEEILRLIDEGYMQHEVAARMHVNQGRVSEVKTGKKFPELTSR